MNNQQTKPIKQFFYCRSCQLDWPIEQLGKIIKSNNSKRCKSCCAHADAAREIAAQRSINP
jgi:hypothetical protein